MIRSVVLPNIGCMLLDMGYIVFMFMWLIPHMDVKHSNGNAFVVMMGVMVGFYGLAMPFARIVDAYIEKWQWELEHYKSVKNTFALFNQYYWHPDWNLRDFPDDLSEAKRLGIDKELSTARDCRIYLYGHDPEENRPPRPKFNSKHTMIEVDGKWHDIPDKFYGRLMDEATVDQFCDMLRDTDVSIYIDSRKAMTKTKITLDKPVAEFLKGFKNK